MSGSTAQCGPLCVCVGLMRADLHGLCPKEQERQQGAWGSGFTLFNPRVNPAVCWVPMAQTDLELTGWQEGRGPPQYIVLWGREGWRGWERMCYAVMGLWHEGGRSGHKPSDENWHVSAAFLMSGYIIQALYRHLKKEWEKQWEEVHFSF
jgi:hypothetical protein